MKSEEWGAPFQQPISMKIGNPLPIGESHGEHGTEMKTQSREGASFSAELTQAIANLPGRTRSNANGALYAGANNLNASRFNGFSQPALLPRIGANLTSGHGIQEAALRVRAYRQQLIATNIANADTPNYRAVDIDVPEALRIARSASTALPLSLSTTVAGHIPAQALFSAPRYSLKYHTPSQASVDGNTVEMDVERSKFAENAVMYEFSLDRVGSSLKKLMELFQTLKD